MIKVSPTELAGVLTVEPRVFGDARGYFFESWNLADFAAAGITAKFVQDNESKSSFGVVRGLHYQAAPYTQAKLIRVVSGTVLDVVVDVRRGSPTYGKHLTIELSGDNKRQLFIPRGFAHGFAVLSPEAVFVYKCDNTYMPSHERGVAFDDPALGIDWRVPTDRRLLSPKDLKHPALADAEGFDFNRQDYLK